MSDSFERVEVYSVYMQQQGSPRRSHWTAVVAKYGCCLTVPCIFCTCNMGAEQPTVSGVFYMLLLQPSSGQLSHPMSLFCGFNPLWRLFFHSQHAYHCCCALVSWPSSPQQLVWLLDDAQHRPVSVHSVCSRVCAMACVAGDTGVLLQCLVLHPPCLLLPPPCCYC